MLDQHVLDIKFCHKGRGKLFKFSFLVNQVESVVGRRRKLGKWEYLIKWKDYGPDVNSWEPEDNLMGCSEAIDQYNSYIKLKKRKSTRKRVKYHEFIPPLMLNLLVMVKLLSLSIYSFSVRCQIILLNG